MMHDDNPLICVVLPTYNRQATLQRAIDSVLAQTYRNLELLVIDDASTDDTPQLLAGIEDPRLRYIRLPANGGVAAARNAGIRAASPDARWIAFQDSDDEWLPGKLERQIGVARADTGVGIVLGAYRAEWDGGFVDVSPRSLLAQGDPLPDILDGWPIITPVWLVRKDLLEQAGGFNGDFCPIEDWDLILRMSERTRIAAAPEPILRKFGSPDSICADRARLCRALTMLVTTHRRRWQGEPQRLARRWAHIGCMSYGPGRRQAARRHFLSALRLDPGSVVPYALYLASFLGSRVLKRVAGIWPRYSSMSL